MAEQCRYCRRRLDRADAQHARYWPFCCERCKLIDLGKWLDEQHRIEEPLEPGAGASGGA